MAIALASAASCAFFSAVVFLGGPRARANRYLVVFLALIAGNQLATAAQAVLGAGGPAALPWFRAGTLFAALDPLFLYAFAAVHPAPNRLHGNGPLALVAGTSFALALLSPAVPTGGPYHLALAGFTAAAYTAALACAVLPRLRGPEARAGAEAGAGGSAGSGPVAGPGPGAGVGTAGGPGAGAAARLLVAGLCLTGVPVWARLGNEAAQALGVDAFSPVRLAVYAPAVAAAAVLALVAARLPVPADARALRLGALAGLGLAPLASPDLFNVASAAGWLGPPSSATPEWAAAAHRVSSAVRWLGFAFLVSGAVVRHAFLDLGVGARRLAARGVVAGLFLAAAGTALLLARAAGGTGGPDATWAVVALAFVVGSQAFRRGVDAAASRLYGVPVGPDLAASLEVYRAAVAEAAARGARPGADPRLARLRADLGLDARAAGVVERMAVAGLGGPLRPGEVVAGRYVVQRLVGRGASGRTFLAEDDLLGRPVALKEVLCDRPEDEAPVLHEARVAGELAHPNVVRVLDVLRRPGSLVLVQEYLPGGSLEDRLRRGPLPPPEAARVADGLLAGLEAVHARGVVHRDLKPANVLLAADGTAKVADFGVARVRRGGTVADGAIVGTPGFMSPEQRRGEPATAASDLYALGVVLRACFPDPGPGLAEVLRRATQEEPSARFASAAEMRAALQRALPPGLLPAATRGTPG